MSRYASEVLNDYFVASSHDLTPASVRHVARLLYLTVASLS